MGRINNTAAYPIKMPNSGDLVAGSKMDENGKTVNFSVESIAALVLASVIGDAFVSEQFTYDGDDNVFVLENEAFKITMVYIENGAFPSEVPIGNVTQVAIDKNLLLEGFKVVIQYIKLG